MAAKGRGGGKTPVRVVELVNKAISEKSIRSISKDTGLGIAAISRYSQGIGEPTVATIEKLALNFGVSVAWLHGYSDLSYEEEKTRVAYIDENERLIKEQEAATDELNGLGCEADLLEKMNNYKDLVLEYKKIPSGSRLEALKILELVTKYENNFPDVRKMITNKAQ